MNLYFEIMIAAYDRAAAKILAGNPRDPVHPSIATPTWVPMTRNELSDFGLIKAKPRARTAKQMKLKGIPRYSILAIHVKSAIYGYTHPSVQHMVERNRAMTEFEQLSAALA